jgi:hypothetical protein
VQGERAVLRGVSYRLALDWSLGAVVGLEPVSQRAVRLDAVSYLPVPVAVTSVAVSYLPAVVVKPVLVLYRSLVPSDLRDGMLGMDDNVGGKSERGQLETALTILMIWSEWSWVQPDFWSRRWTVRRMTKESGRTFASLRGRSSSTDTFVQIRHRACTTQRGAPTARKCDVGVRWVIVWCRRFNVRFKMWSGALMSGDVGVEVEACACAGSGRTTGRRLSMT